MPEAQIASNQGNADPGSIRRATGPPVVTEVPNDSPALERVEAELIAREPIFHRPELGTSREDHLSQTAEDYWEVAASGRVYDRQSVLDVLAARGKVPGDEDWVISDVRLRPLAADTYALTYHLDQAGRRTRRLTLWRHDPGGWQILYHQGTVIEHT